MKMGRMAYNQSVTMANAEKAYAMPPLWLAEMHVPPSTDRSQAYDTGWHWKSVKKKQIRLYAHMKPILKRKMWM